MLLKDIISAIETRIQMPLAEDFDNVGLLCGNPDRECSGVLICHDSLESVVDEAIIEGLNLIVAFHPIIFKGLKKITGKNYVEKAILKAIENKIAIYAVHTAFDNDFFGVNSGICDALSLRERKILMPQSQSLCQLTFYVPVAHSESVRSAVFSAGAGNIGFYDECSFSLKGTGTFRPREGANPFSGTLGIREKADEEMISVIFESYKTDKILEAMRLAHPYEEVAYQIYQLKNENQYAGLGMVGNLDREMDVQEFLRFLKMKFNVEMLRHSHFSKEKIRKVAVLGGSGASGIPAALSQNCDAYVTADLKYHDFFLPEGKMLLCDVGHYESEQFVVQQLFEILSEKFPKFAIRKTTVTTNPVNYF